MNRNATLTIGSGTVQWFGYQRGDLVDVGAVGDRQRDAVEESVRWRRVGRTRWRHREGAGENVGCGNGGCRRVSPLEVFGLVPVWRQLTNR
jgi:hypothetical protein